jgi:hypothetical protein
MPKFPPFSSRRASYVLALALAIPFSAPRAETDCESLDIALDPAAGFSKLACDSGSFAGGGPSHTAEGIVASDAASFFVVRHAVAGVRTYFTRLETRALIDQGATFEKIEDWTAAPGGNGFAVARFKGRLTGTSDLPLACFGFSRFSGHVASTTGFRHLVYGFYCTALADQVPDDDVRRLTGSIKFTFE